ncbi:unnamed protein product [Bursaphelenchus okinawaensis]|uniref:C3H1-type domain-containing protein n=1 Tax=Bursaphelenchus okinawaensis TaxID=465554 RepID=A0A811K9Q6_9BILA|nr:unnamed protein product [Bursaphelenchus okinawaensis]CAG9095321.1 unnamed protein product [Bursaphelenchus okinawaensis]
MDRNDGRRLESIPVHRVNRSNIKMVKDDIFKAIRSAQFIAIDLEMTGLGPRVSVRTKMEERYQMYKLVANLRSIVSVGFSFFSRGEQNDRILYYKASVYDVLLTEAEAFTVDPSSLQFLVQHGTDLNQWITNGVMFKKRSDDSLNTIFNHIFESGASLFLHNGLIDMMFIYHNFYLPLPPTCSEFLANLSDLYQPTDAKNIPKAYQTAIIDTKYIADKQAGLPASFLEYLFRRCRRDNLRNGDVSVNVEFKQSDGEDVSVIQSRISDAFWDGNYDRDNFKHICPRFASFGFCPKHNTCPLDHDVEVVLDKEDFDKIKKSKGVKRPHDPSTSSDNNGEHNSDEKTSSNSNDLGCHNAGMDAFMTGFVALYLNAKVLHNQNRIPPELVGRFPVANSEYPLLIRTEQHIKRDDLHHVEKLLVIQRARALRFGEFKVVEDTLINIS